jgi:hypothetical protein
MTKLGPNEKIYPVIKIATVVESLKGEGVSPKEALAGTNVPETQLISPAVRVSANQVSHLMECMGSQSSAAQTSARQWRLQ